MPRIDPKSTIRTFYLKGKSRPTSQSGQKKVSQDYLKEIERLFQIHIGNPKDVLAIDQLTTMLDVIFDNGSAAQKKASQQLLRDLLAPSQNATAAQQTPQVDDKSNKAISIGERHVFKNLAGDVRSVDYNLTRNEVLVASKDNQAFIADATTGRKKAELENFYGWFTGAYYTDDRTRIVGASAQDKLCIWDAKTGRQLETIDVFKGEIIHSIVMSPCQTEVFMTTSSRSAMKYDLKGKMPTVRYHHVVDGQKAGVSDSPLGGVRRNAHYGVFDRSGQHVLMGLCSSGGVLVDAHSGEERLSLSKAPTWFRSLEMNALEDKILGVSNNGDLLVMDASDGSMITSFEAEKTGTSGYRHALFIGDGSRIAATRKGGLFSKDGECNAVYILDSKTLDVLGTLEGHDAEIKSIALSRDQKRLLTASEDGTAAVFDLESKKQLLEIQSQIVRLSSAEFEKSERRVVLKGDESVELVELKYT